MSWHSWPPHDWRAGAALASLTFGGIALTAFAIWIVYLIASPYLWTTATEAARVRYLGMGLLLLLTGVIAVLLSQGFAINRRKIVLRGPAGTEIILEGGGGFDPATLEKVETLHTPQQPIENDGVSKD